MIFQCCESRIHVWANGPGLAFVLLAFVVLGGCSVGSRTTARAPDLERDIARFGGDRPVVDAAEFLAVDASMRDFVRSAVGERASPGGKLDGLMERLFRGGDFKIDYDADLSLTAARTFHRRTGNCLSATALLVALARAAGLDARFQDVEERPRVSLEESFSVRARHVNAVIELGWGEQVTVDFDRRSRDPVRATPIEDAVATAQFFSNLGVEAMREEDWALAHANFRRAVELAPDLGYVWNNVGVLYRRAGYPERAEKILLHAIEVDSGDLSAMSNLVALYRYTGQPDRARVFEKRLEAARRKDPYYLYALAHRAFREDDLATSISYLHRAIELKGDEPAFHELLQRVETDY